MKRAAAIAAFSLVSVGATTARAEDEVLPAGVLVRILPGGGFAGDRADGCRLRGRMFTGGFSIGHAVASGLFVGGQLLAAVNLVDEDAPCIQDGKGLGIASTIGPMIEWYPSSLGGGYGRLGLAYAEIQYNPHDESRSRGVGAIVAIGADTAITGDRATDLRLGVELQLTVLDTWTSAVGHMVVMPSFAISIGFD